MKNVIKIQLLPIEEKTNHSSPIIIMSSDLMKQTNLMEGQQITLKSGRCEVECIVSLHPSENRHIIYGSKHIFEELFLPDCSLYLYLYIKPHERLVEFGPFIGVVTDYIKDNKFGTIHSFIKELQTYANRNHLFLYVFHFQHFFDNYVKGTWYNPIISDWQQAKLPIPHAVHNRIHSRIKEKSKEAKQFFEKLNVEDIPYFNERFLTKWEVYEVLSSYDHLLPYLPETKLLNGRATIEEMSALYDRLFLKPVHGSQGKGIFKIEKKNDRFLLDYTTFSGEIEKYYSSIHPIYEVIRPKLLTQRFIIQQGLHLLTYDGRPLDFRLLCHRQNENNWTVTSIVARVSSKNEFVSNLSRGGEIFKIHHVLKEHFDKKTIYQIKQLLIEIAIEAAQTIHQFANGLFGELGIDLAIDTEGKPWIIEINTKPSKNQDPDDFLPTIRPSAKAIIDYCYNLTGWKM